MDNRKIISDAEAEYGNIWKEIQDDLEFESGQQWDADEVAERDQDFRPHLTTNLCRTYINRICNPYLKTPLSIEVGKDKRNETDKLLSTIINDIESSSSAISKYYKSYRTQVISGYGYLLARAAYKSELTLEQEIIIESLAPHEVAIDKSDNPRWAVIKQSIDMDIAIGLGYEAPDNRCINDKVVMYTIYKLDTKMIKRGFMTNSSYQDMEMDAEIAEGYMQVRNIPVTSLSISRTIENIDMDDVVVYKDIDTLPLVQLAGEQSLINGESLLQGMISRMRDPQTQTNRTNTVMQEVLENLVTDPFIGTAQQLEGVEDHWKMESRKPKRVLLYNPVSIGNQLLPAPARTGSEQNLQLALQAKQNATSDMSRTTSVTDQMLGEGETAGVESGVAIAQKNLAGEINMITYTYNFKEALRKFGKILLKMYGAISPEIVVEVEGQSVTIPKDQYTQLVNQCEISINQGPHEVEANLRNRAMLSELIKIMPQAAPLLAIEILLDSDKKDKDKLADKLKKMLPPEWQDAEDQKQVDPEAEQALQAAQGTIDQLNEQNDYLINVVRQFQQMQIDDEADRKNKMDIEELKSKTSITNTQIKANADIEKVKLQNGAKAEENMINAIAENEKAKLDAIGEVVSQSIQVDERMMQPINPQGIEDVGPIAPMANGPVSLDQIQ